MLNFTINYQSIKLWKMKKTILDEYNNPIVIHTNQDFEKMRKAGNLARKF